MLDIVGLLIFFPDKQQTVIESKNPNAGLMSSSKAARPDLLITPLQARVLLGSRENAFLP